MRVSMFAFSAVLIVGTLTPGIRADETKSYDDSRFLKEALSGGFLEVRLAGLALERSENPAVQNLAKRITTDHMQANEKLIAMLQSRKLEVSKTLLPKHQEMLDELLGSEAAKFEGAYVMMMIDDHKADIKEFEEAADESAGEDVRKFAANTLPHLREHLRLAKDAKAKIDER